MKATGARQERPEDQLTWNRVVGHLINHGIRRNASRVTDGKRILQRDTPQGRCSRSRFGHSSCRFPLSTGRAEAISRTTAPARLPGLSCLWTSCVQRVNGTKLETTLFVDNRRADGSK